MNQRDIRERVLRHQLKHLAAKLDINEHAMIREAEALGMIRDAREAAGEVHLHISGLPSVEEMQSMLTEAIVAAGKRDNEVRTHISYDPMSEPGVIQFPLRDLGS